MEVQKLIEYRLTKIKERYDKLIPALQGKTLGDYLSYQPLRNINPHDPSDPIPYRTDPNACFTSYEVTLLAEQLKLAHKTLSTQPTTISTWSLDNGLLGVVNATYAKLGIPPWIAYITTKLVIGTCTAARKLDTGFNKPVKRGQAGLIIDPKAVEIIPDKKLREIVESFVDNFIVVFDDEALLVTKDNLNKVKFDKQLALF